ncbi:MAG: RNA polymerase sigma factor [Proteobacteria bacterium]|nr:MAG: RNA polymerase sigma factor [Pseudomonadota bacterium]
MPSRSERSLEDLLEDYRDGSPEAFETFFRKTRNIVFHYVQRRIKNLESSQDITQEIYLRIHRYIVSFDREKGNAMSWIRSIAHNCIANHFTLQRTLDKLSEDEYLREVSLQTDANDKLYYEDMIFQFQGFLNADELDILIGRLISESSFNEIGIQKGINADHARQKFSRILRKIKKLLN